jgi:hypothetical protein
MAQFVNDCDMLGTSLPDSTSWDVENVVVQGRYDSKNS